MKCISLWNPYAFLMSINAKKNETRSWYTKYRGTLAIHSAKKWDKGLLELCYQEPFFTVLSYERPNQGGCFSFDQMLEVIMPFGKIIAVVDVIACEKITSSNRPTGNELAFGDYTKGRFMWITDNLRKLKEPIPFKGKQGFFEIPDSLVSEVI